MSHAGGTILRAAVDPIYATRTAIGLVSGAGNLLGGVGDAFKSPKLPKVQPLPPPPADTTADQNAIGQANLMARQAARRRLGVLATLGASSSAATGIAGSPRTTTGGLIGS